MVLIKLRHPKSNILFKVILAFGRTKFKTRQHTFQFFFAYLSTIIVIKLFKQFGNHFPFQNSFRIQQPPINRKILSQILDHFNAHSFLPCSFNFTSLQIGIYDLINGINNENNETNDRSDHGFSFDFFCNPCGNLND